MKRQTVLLVFAAVFAAAGGWLAWRAIVPPSRAVATEPPVTAPVDDHAMRLPVFSHRVAPEFETHVDRENVGRVASDVRSSAESASRSTGALAPLTVSQQDALFEAVEEQARVYLGASFEGYRAFMRRAGGRRAYVDQAGDDPEAIAAAWRTVEQVWTSMAEPIAFKPISLDDVVLRMRYLRGERVPTPDDFYAKVVFNRPDAWPELSGDPERNSYTIAELMIPVFYHRDTVAASVYFAIWFVYDEKAGDWKIHQTRMYEPSLAYNLVCPSF